MLSESATACECLSVLKKNEPNKVAVNFQAEEWFVICQLQWQWRLKTDGI